MFNDELWLRPGQPGATCFKVFFDAEQGHGGFFQADVSESMNQPAQITKWPSDLILWGLRGRGIIETADGTKSILGASTSLRIPAYTSFSWRNELREEWSMLCFLSDGRAVSFLHSLPMCKEDFQLLDESKGYDLSLHLPPLVPDLPPAIKALENRISYPLGAPFSL